MSARSWVDILFIRRMTIFSLFKYKWNSEKSYDILKKILRSSGELFYLNDVTASPNKSWTVLAPAVSYMLSGKIFVGCWRSSSPMDIELLPIEWKVDATVAANDWNSLFLPRKSKKNSKDYKTKLLNAIIPVSLLISTRLAAPDSLTKTISPSLADLFAC